MHSTSKLTCSARTSATVRGSVMTGSGRTGRKATYRQQAVHTGAQRATASIRPEPFSLNPAPAHGSPGWGEAPLGRSVQLLVQCPVRVTVRRGCVRITRTCWSGALSRSGLARQDSPANGALAHGGVTLEGLRMPGQDLWLDELEAVKQARDLLRGARVQPLAGL